MISATLIYVPNCMYCEGNSVHFVCLVSLVLYQLNGKTSSKAMSTLTQNHPSNRCYN